MSTPPNALKGIIYTRGSTIEQQNTLVAQRTQAELYCQLKGIEAVHVAVDEGESAVAVDFLERPVVADMLAKMQELGATHIIITKLDRGFRSATDLLSTIKLLDARGIGVHLLDIGLDPTTPVGKMIATIMAAIATFECERRSERQKAAFEVMRASGQRTGSVPYGWHAVPAARKSKTGRAAEDLVANAFEQTILARLVNGDLSATAGVSCNEAARRLNAAGITTKRGKKWFGATVECYRRTAILSEAQAEAKKKAA